MESTLEELRRISNCLEGATFSQLSLRKSETVWREGARNGRGGGGGGWAGRGDPSSLAYTRSARYKRAAARTSAPPSASGRRNIWRRRQSTAALESPAPERNRTRAGRDQ